MQKHLLNGSEGPMHAFEQLTVYYSGTFHFERCSWSSEVRRNKSQTQNRADGLFRKQISQH